MRGRSEYADTLRMYRRGFSVKNIAVLYGVSTSRVYKVLKVARRLEKEVQ